MFQLTAKKLMNISSIRVILYREYDPYFEWTLFSLKPE